MSLVPYSVVFAGEAHASLLKAVLPGPTVCVKNREELSSATATRGAVAFIDFDLLNQIDAGSTEVPIIAIIDSKPSDALADAIRSLDAFPWLSHVVVASTLSTPRARQQLAVLLEKIVVNPEQSMLGGAGVGRAAFIAKASRREARFERMREFFAKQNLSDRSITTIIEVAEELVMNALYDAPTEAGYFESPRQRSEDVELPPELACEISYGIEDGTAFVRLRDRFGALSRSRLVQVLNRCNTTEVSLDVSRGGAGLGLWRVFSVASTIAITVIRGSLTDILVGIRTKDGRAITKQLHALHLFFASKNDDSLSHLPSDDHGLIDQSITLILVA